MTKRALKRQLREGTLDLTEFNGDPRIRRLPVERAWSPLPRRPEDDRDQGYVKTVRPMSEGQKAMMEAVDSHNLVLALGPAGTGKTYLAISKAVEALEAGKVGRIVLTKAWSRSSSVRRGRGDQALSTGSLRIRGSPSNSERSRAPSRS